MVRVAGIWSSSAGPTRAFEERVRSSLTDYGMPVVHETGSLTLASTPAVESFRQAGVLTLLGGRLDNAQALAGELGLPPATPAPELAAAAHARWGDEGLGRLRGTFVVVVWDSRAARGVCAVDQLGSAALFFSAWNSRLVFASELRDLLRLLPRRPSPDPVAAAQLLASAALERGRTFFDGVRRLCGGHLLAMETTWAEREYWRPRYAEPLRVPPDDLVAELRAAIETSVGRRLPQSGSIGVLVSGGLDSSTVVASAARAAPGQVSAYSIVFPEHEAMDESVHIESLMSQLDVPSVLVPVREGSPVAASLGLLARFEVPWHSPNLTINLPVLNAAGSDGVDILLDGEGGDELFGFSRYLLADYVRRGRILSALRLASRMPAVGDDRRLQRAVVREFGVKGALPHSAHAFLRRIRGTDHYAPPWLEPGTAKLYLEHDDSWSWKRLSGPRWWAYLANLLTAWREALGHDGLRRRAEYVGLEGGHPFLDDLDLIELVLRFPPELLFDRRGTRPLLRQAIRGLVPDDIRLRRDKPTLGSLVYESLQGRDWAAVMRLLGAGEPEVGAFVSIPAMRRVFLDAPEASRGVRWASTLWHLVTLECWLRRERDPSFAERFRAELAND
jgi:asparagine synthase (glutamine-hydrolysing)